MPFVETLRNLPLHLDKLDEILRLVPPHWFKFDTAFHLGTALALKRAAGNPHFFKKLSRNESILNKLNFISFISNAVFVAAKIEETWGAISVLRPLPHVIVLTALGVPIVLTFVSLKLVSLINKIASGNLRGVDKSYPYTRPKREVYHQLFYTARIITQIAATYFAPTNPFFIFGIACEAYSLLKITQRKWIEFKYEATIELEKNKEIRNQGIPLMPLESTISAVSKIRVLTNPKAGEVCALCRQKNPANAISLCGKHFFHIDCTCRHIQETMVEFPNQIVKHQAAIERELTYESELKGHQIVDQELEASYEISLPTTSLPCCPSCQLQPEWNEFSASIGDALFGTTPLKIHLKSPSN